MRHRDSAGIIRCRLGDLFYWLHWLSAGKPLCRSFSELACTRWLGKPCKFSGQDLLLKKLYPGFQRAVQKIYVGNLPCAGQEKWALSSRYSKAQVRRLQPNQLSSLTISFFLAKNAEVSDLGHGESIKLITMNPWDRPRLN